MFSFDTSKLASDIANVLLLRGSQMPPLQWHVNANKAAKEILEAKEDDTALFRGSPIVEESMAAAVRAMLYVWSGWPADCKMYAQAAPQQIQMFLEAICERQAGRPAEAKELLTRVGEFDTYGQLAAHAVETIGPGSDKSLTRFKGTLELCETWEPHAFVDLFEQARLGALCHPAERVTRNLQGKEFELLFVHCYETAIGGTIGQCCEKNEVARRNISRKTPARRRASPLQPIETTQPTQTNSDAATPLPTPLNQRAPRVGISCPKCQTVIVLPEKSRGRPTECKKCGTSFLVPKKQVSSARAS